MSRRCGRRVILRQKLRPVRILPLKPRQSCSKSAAVRLGARRIVGFRVDARNSRRHELLFERIHFLSLTIYCRHEPSERLPTRLAVPTPPTRLGTSMQRRVCRGGQTRRCRFEMAPPGKSLLHADLMRWRSSDVSPLVRTAVASASDLRSEEFDARDVRRSASASLAASRARFGRSLLRNSQERAGSSKTRPVPELHLGDTLDT